MLQIAIIGIALMLVVKGWDFLIQQQIARSAGHQGSPVLVALGFIAALMFAFGLAVAASDQASHVSSSPLLGNP